MEVAVLLAKGLINKEIGDRLHISVTTVITHRKNIMEKLHARSLADIIIYAVMNGLVDVGEI
jgi:DNA-binding NarL/FixJ family response regulator